MYKDYRFINAGVNEIYRYGHKAVDLVKSYLTPNESGFYSIPADGGRYYTIGTSEGKFGEFAKFNETFLSVNKAGYVWAKVGSPKAEAFISMINQMISDMNKANAERIANLQSDEEED